MKKISEKLGMGGILACFIILGTISWYVSTLVRNSLVFCVCIVVLAAVSGYLLVLHEKTVMEKENENQHQLINAINSLQSEMVHMLVQMKNAVVEEVHDVQDKIESNSATMDRILTQLDGAETNLQNALTVQTGTVTNKFDTAIRELSKQNDELKAKTNEIKNAVTINEHARKEDTARTAQNLKGIANSFKNAVEAYQEMERRRASLEQQNVHLQMLTTTIGTVRSDIATINEVKGFVAEAKAGRKIRITRDDENKVVVESLMDSNGVRIEKSKMYRNKQLAFEAIFDSAGKMIMSRSYSNGELSTEVTYAPENNGYPTIRDMVKEKVSGVFGKKDK